MPLGSDRVVMEVMVYSLLLSVKEHCFLLIIYSHYRDAKSASVKVRAPVSPLNLKSLSLSK